MKSIDAMTIKNSPAPVLNTVSCLAVIDSLMQDEGATARELAAKLNLNVREVMAVMGHPEFTKRFRKIKREVAKAEFDAIAYDQLINIIKTEDVPAGMNKDGEQRYTSNHKNQIQAAKVLSEILGLDEKKTVVEHKFSFEEIVREENSTINITPETRFPGFDDE